MNMVPGLGVHLPGGCAKGHPHTSDLDVEKGSVSKMVRAWVPLGFCRSCCLMPIMFGNHKSIRFRPCCAKFGSNDPRKVFSL